MPPAPGGPCRASLRLALPLLLFMVLVNVLVSHRGETVLVRGWEMPVLGNTDITLESLAAGAVIGLRVVAVVLVFAVYSACVDPDRVLRALRPDRPPLGDDGRAGHADGAARRQRMAPGCGRPRRSVARPRRRSGRAALARRLVEGSLDRAVDVAATLELRGHSLRRAPANPPRALARRRCR